MHDLDLEIRLCFRSQLPAHNHHHPSRIWIEIWLQSCAIVYEEKRKESNSRKHLRTSKWEQSKGSVSIIVTQRNLLILGYGDLPECSLQLPISSLQPRNTQSPQVPLTASFGIPQTPRTKDHRQFSSYLSTIVGFSSHNSLPGLLSPFISIFILYNEYVGCWELDLYVTVAGHLDWGIFIWRFRK